MSSYSDLILGTTGLVSYWRLNEPSGTNAEDILGSNDGTYTGGVTLDRPSALASDPADRAALFDGTDDHVALAGALPNTPPFTVEAWVNPAVDLATIREVVGRSGSWVFGRQDAKLRFTTIGIADYTTTASYFTLGAWVHIAATFKADQDVDFYVNGAFVQTVAGASDPAAGTAAGDIGRRTLTAAQHWAGTIDEVAAYDVALTAQQVTAHYQAGAARHLSLTGVGA